MRVYADASFLVSLYGADEHSPVARTAQSPVDPGPAQDSVQSLRKDHRGGGALGPAGQRLYAAVRAPVVRA